MKILFVVNVDWFFISHRLCIAEAAIAKGYSVHVGTRITSNANAQLLRDRGLYVHNIPFDRSASPFGLTKAIFSLFCVYLSVKPQLVHLVTSQAVIIGGFLAKFLNINSVVFSISGLGHVFLGTSFLSKVRRIVVLNLYKMAFSSPNKLIIFQNSNDLSILSEACQLNDAELLLLNGSGVDLDKFCPSPLPKSGPPVVLMASRLIKSKGVYDFVEASRILRRRGLCAEFWLAGRPDSDNPLSIDLSLVLGWQNQGLIKYLGDRPDLHKIIPKCYLFVLPSFYPEGLPKVLCEAAACGRPIITTSLPGCSECVDHCKSGFLVPPREPILLADCISTIINNKDLAASMGTQSRIKASSSFSQSLIVEKHLESYSKLHQST